MTLGDELRGHLPYLRRYARALTGSQQHGDNYVHVLLEVIVAAPDEGVAAAGNRLSPAAASAARLPMLNVARTEARNRGRSIT